MARRDLKDDEQILYEELTKKLNRYLFTSECKECIGLVDDLIDAIIKNDEEDNNYNDWNF